MTLAPEGLDDPWLYYLPALHRTLAAPGIPTTLPCSFVSLDDEQTRAWWETLRYLLRSLIGWRNLPAGLAWWFEAGKPTLDDPRLSLILERWNTRGELDYFAAREWKHQGLDLHCQTPKNAPPSDYEPTPGWMRELETRRSPLEHCPFKGGYNPLHLGHSDILLENEKKGLHHGGHDEPSRTAALCVSDFTSWQQELQLFGSRLPPLANQRSWKIDVHDRQVGYLGRFRQSRITSLWFQGKHSIHIAGNPQ